MITLAKLRLDMQAKLYIPSFTKGKDQLSALEVEDTRSIANVRTHVEQVIGTVCQKYSVLDFTYRFLDQKGPRRYSPF